MFLAISNLYVCTVKLQSRIVFFIVFVGEANFYGLLIWIRVERHFPLESTVTNENASQMYLWDVSYSVSETSQRGLICKSLRRLVGDWLKMSPQRRLWDLSGFLRDVFELHLQVLAFKLRHCSSNYIESCSELSLS